jgi:hypothetical protein
MKRHIIIFTIQFLGVILIGISSSYSFPTKEFKMNSGDIEKIILLAKRGDVSAAEKLAHVTVNIDSEKINDDTLRRLASLLDSPNGSVRLWAAAAIGNFGARATEYAPRLQKIVSEEACNMTGLSAADTASSALNKMKITTVPFGCKD